MGSRIVLVGTNVGVPALPGPCDSREDSTKWRSHTTHIASGEPALFSIRSDKEGSNPKIDRCGLADSRQHSWWGLCAVGARPDQIFQN